MFEFALISSSFSSFPDLPSEVIKNLQLRNFHRASKRVGT